MSAEDINRLSELKELMEVSEKKLIISSTQIDHVLETVIPGLERLGTVHIADSITKRLVETPLRAKLFLDRIKHRLVAGVEFHYGHLVINPCEETEDEFRHYPGVRRQRNKEQEIMKLIQGSSFNQTDGGFYMHDEEAEYHFLFHVVPDLEKLVQIYATTAVKLRVQKAYVGPKIKVEIGERTDWLAFRFDLQGVPESEIKKILKSLEEKRKYYRIPNGTLMSLETKEFLSLNDFLHDLGITSENFDDEVIRVPLIQGMQLAESLEDGHLVDPGKTFAKLMKNLHRPEDLDSEVPESLESVLRDYQKVGYPQGSNVAQ